ncbi:MAG: hypothetical protein AMJ81_04980 [Phycisphaerae bacterium SM23_33]|nr:MAG: hypothetical protein AMJ81_04980 [Phycisphaerae bacterium SM23_33]
MSEPLGQLQLQVMEIVWRLGRATVAEAHEVLAGSRKIAYTTVLTTMRALERRGMVRHERAGKAYLYEPLVSRADYAASSVHRLVDDLFDGSREKLLCHLLGADRISRAELARIRRMIRGRQENTS